MRSQPAFYCGVEWHLWRSGLQLGIYTKIGQLTDWGDRAYFTSALKMADFLGANQDSTEDAFRQLRKKGWLTQLPSTQRVAALEQGELRPGAEHDLRTGRFKPHDYMIVKHAAWAEQHPGHCFTDPNPAPWHNDGTADPLAVCLNAECAGKVRWPESVIKGLRSTGMADNLILNEFREFVFRLSEQPRTPYEWRMTKTNFLKSFLEVSE